MTPSVVKLKYIMCCKITLRFDNNVPLLYCEITTEFFPSLANYIPCGKYSWQTLLGLAPAKMNHINNSLRSKLY